MATKYLGVSYSARMGFEAKITPPDSERVRVGYYANEFEAAVAYDREASKYDMPTNFNQAAIVCYGLSQSLSSTVCGKPSDGYAVLAKLSDLNTDDEEF